MRKALISIVSAVLIYAPSAWSAEYEKISRIDHVWEDRIVLPGGLSFDLITQQTPRSIRNRVGFTTRCMEDKGREIDCEMLMDVGYVDRARIVVSGSAVKELQVLELMQ